MRVQQESGYLLQLVRQTLEGNCVPAAFQRPYVWNEADIEALWDSIVMGLPIGSFLLWRPSGDELERFAQPTLGPVPLVIQRYASLILDGQNRLVSMAWSQTAATKDIDPAVPGYALWRSGKTLVADPYQRRVRFIENAAVGSDLCLPTHHLGDDLQRWIRANWDGNEEDLAHIEWFNDLEQRIRQARIIITTLNDATPTEARAAFLRIARAGVPISQEDFDAAIGWSEPA